MVRWFQGVCNDGVYVVIIISLISLTCTEPVCLNDHLDKIHDCKRMYERNSALLMKNLNPNIIHGQCRINNDLTKCMNRFPQCRDQVQETTAEVTQLYRYLCDPVFINQHLPCIVDRMASGGSACHNATQAQLKEQVFVAADYKTLRIDEYCMMFKVYIDCMEYEVQHDCGRDAANAMTNVLVAAAQIMPNCNLEVNSVAGITAYSYLVAILFLFVSVW